MNRVFWASATAFVALGTFSAVHAQDYSGMNCRDITADAERLACYDAQAGTPAQAAPSAAPSSAPALSSVPAPMSEAEKFGLKQASKVERTEEEFGSVNLRKEQRAERRALRAANKEARQAEKAAKKAEKAAAKAASLDAIDAQLVKFRTLADGRTRFTLSNGQVWDQIAPQKVKLKAGPSPAVTIERAALGSFRMKVGDLPGTYKVRRVK